MNPKQEPMWEYGYLTCSAHDPAASEFWCADTGQWIEAKPHGLFNVPGDRLAWRKKLDPGDGWEIVPESEARLFKGEPRRGVQFFHPDYGWQFAQAPTWTGWTAFRRGQTERRTGKWVSVRDRLPGDWRVFYPVVVRGSDRIGLFNFDGSRWICRDGANDREAERAEVTHWLDLPCIPPEGDEAKKACAAWRMGNPNPTIEEAWLAGRKWQSTRK